MRSNDWGIIVDSRSPAGNGSHEGRGGIRSGPGRRLAASGLALVLATSLYACGVAQADEHTPATTPPSAPDTTTSAEATEGAVDVPETPSGAEGENGNTPAAGPTNRPAGPGTGENTQAALEPPAAPGRPTIVSPPSGGKPPVIRGTGTGEEQRSARAAVALNEIARPADGIEVTVREVRAVQSEGEVPGYRYGPAVVLKVSVRNATDAPISTLASTVTVEYGPDARPADLSPQAEDEPLPSEIAAGRTEVGTYTFLVPESGRDDMSVTVSYRAVDPAVVLEGPARLVGQIR